MTLKAKIDNEITNLIGATHPQTVSLPAGDGVMVTLDFTAVDTMSCSLREIRLDVPSLGQSDFAALKQWAESLSQRVTYLLENIAPLEFAEDHGKVLIRSTPPDKSDDGTRFYEILLQSHKNGSFSLRRYSSQSGQSGRSQVDIQTTHEVLKKLVVDLVETIPAAN